MEGLLSGRKIFITGGTRGIGEAVVRACLDEGAYVGFTYLNSYERAKMITGKNSAKAFAYRADAKDLSQMEDALSKFSNEVHDKGLNGLVINAGIYKRASMNELTRTDWDNTIETNLTGAFNTVKAALSYMDKGSLVLVSSQLAFRGSASGADYSSSKAGMLGLSRSLAKELAPHIRVNSIAPGYVDTDILAGDSPEKRSRRISEVPLNRVGSPEDIAKPVVFLLSDMSSYITGATVDINGGLFIH